MPLPLILGVGAAVAATLGVGSGVKGAAKMKEANDTMKLAEQQHKKNTARFDAKSEAANQAMDELGTYELNILKDFDKFSDTIEKIQNRPKFAAFTKSGVKLPTYEKEELNNVSVGAGVLLGGLGGAAAGTAGGFAAAGAATSAVMALGTASTGTAIASLSGAAATNATLAALGGGALAAGGGGIALGTTILSATTLGVGLLVGGVIFNVAGKKLSDNADEAYRQMKEAEKTIDAICSYLEDLEHTANQYMKMLRAVKNKYDKNFDYLSYVVNQNNKTDWRKFTEQEKTAAQNAVLLVGILYNMCKVSLVNKASDNNEMNTINKTAIDEAVRNAEKALDDVA